MRRRDGKSSRFLQPQADRKRGTGCARKQPRQPSIAKNTNPLSNLPWPIQMVAPNHLKTSPHNTRTHPNKQIGQIVKSIHQFGYTNPALVDERYKIIGGHARIEAAQRAGLEKVPA
jgi:ParB-like nuclease domain